MVYFLNSKVKTHTEDALQYIFDENKEKIVILGYSIVSRRSPLQKERTTLVGVGDTIVGANPIDNSRISQSLEYSRGYPTLKYILFSYQFKCI